MSGGEPVGRSEVRWKRKRQLPERNGLRPKGRSMAPNAPPLNERRPLPDRHLGQWRFTCGENRLAGVSTHGLAASPLIAVRRIDLVFLDSPGIPTNALPTAERAPAPDVLRCTAQGHLRGCGQYWP